jgi:hypothetical protein
MVVAIRIVVEGRNAQEEVRRVRVSFDELGSGIQKALEQAKSGFQTLTQRLGSLREFARQAASTMAGFLGVQALGNIREMIDSAIQAQTALAGLAGIARSFGVNTQEATALARRFASTGLMSVGEAAEAVRNLLVTTGGNLQLTAQFMELATRQSAAFRQAHYSLGEAIVVTTRGLKDEISTLSDAIGVTTNISQLQKQYAESIGKTVGQLTDQERRMGAVVMMIREMQRMTSGLNESQLNAQMQLAKSSQAFKDLQITLGQALMPVLLQLSESARGLAAGFRPVIEGVGLLMRGVNAIPGGVTIAVAALGAWKFGLFDVIGGLLQAVRAGRSLTVVLQAMNSGILQVVASMAAWAAAHPALTAAMVAMGGVLAFSIKRLNEAKRAIDEIRQSAEQSAPAWRVLAQFMRELGESGPGALERAFRQMNVELARNADGTIDAARSLENLRRAATEGHLAQTRYAEALNRATEAVERQRAATEALIPALLRGDAIAKQLAADQEEYFSRLAKTPISVEEIRKRVEALQEAITKAAVATGNVTGPMRVAREQVQGLVDAAEALGISVEKTLPELAALARSTGAKTEAMRKAEEAARQYGRELERLRDRVKEVLAEHTKFEIKPEEVLKESPMEARLRAMGRAVEEQNAPLERMRFIASQLGVTLTEDLNAAIQEAVLWFQQLVMVTGDAGAATEALTKIAADAARNWDRLTVETKEKLAGLGITSKEAAEQIAGAAKQSSASWNEFREALGQVLADAIRMFGDWVGKVLRVTSGLGQFLIRAFGSLGEALGGATGPITKAIGSLFSKIGGSVGQLLGSIVPGLGTAIGTVAGTLVGGLLGKVFSLFKKRKEPWKEVGQEIGRTMGISISDELAKKIDDLAKRVGSRAKAVALSLGEIVGDIMSRADLSKAMRAVGEVLQQLKRGVVDAASAAKGIGDVFSKVLSFVGDRVDAAVIGMIQAVRAAGLRVKEIDEFIIRSMERAAGAIEKLAGIWTQQFESGAISADEFRQKVIFLATASVAAFQEMVRSGASFLEAFDKFKKGFDAIIQAAIRLGLANDEAVQSLQRWRDLIEANRSLIEEIETLNQLMRALGQTGTVSLDQIRFFQDQILNQYQRLIAAGFTQNEVLRLIAPSLQTLADLARAYGFELDENTRRLIEQARQQGLITDEQLSLQDILIQGFAEIIRLLGGEIPEAWKKVIEATRQAADEAGRYADEVRRARDELESMPAPGKPSGGEVGAQHGFFGVVSRPTRFLVGEAGPEMVLVAPLRRSAPAGPAELGMEGGVQVTVNVYAQTFDENFVRFRLVPALSDVLRRYSAERERLRGSLGG